MCSPSFSRTGAAVILAIALPWMAAGAGMPLASAVSDGRETATTSQQPERAMGAASEFLAGIPQENRRAASIEIELLTEQGAGDLTTAGNIAGLWNSGRHAEAIEVLRRFEAAGARVAVGVSWAAGGAPAGTRELTDVRIGAPRNDARTVDIDFDAETEHGFSVARWGTGTGEAHWTNNFSWTHGSTWTETYAWFSSIGIVDVDAAVVGDWLYVGYIAGGHEDEVRVRRCHVAHGRVDNSYYYKVALDAGASSFKEMVLTTDADDYDSEVYVLAIQADAVLRFAWATATDGIFTDVDPPATANLSEGLSATYGMHGACGATWFWVSYVDTDNHLRLLRYVDDHWSDMLTSPVGALRETSISAHARTVICAYEKTTTSGTGIDYFITYECGSGGAFGTLAIPDGVNVLGYFCPSVDARTGRGTAAIYQAETGDPDIVYYRTRAGYAPGSWADPVAFNDYDVLTGSDTALSPLRAGTGYFDLAAIYISSYGARVPYLDKPGATWSSVPEVRAEAATLRLLAAPNPFRAQTTLRLELPAAGQVRIELFDLLGRRAATLLDETVVAGAHEVPVKGHGLRSGHYFYRLTSGTQTDRGRLIVVP